MLTTAKAAEQLGIRPGTVRALIARGQLQAQKIGRDHLIEQAEIDRYRAERRPAHRPIKAAEAQPEQ